MGTTLFTQTAAREASYEMTQYIAGRLTLPATNVLVGTLPAGAVISAINTRNVTAFSGGTPVFSVGTTPTGVDIATGIANAAGTVSTVPLAALTLPTTVPTNVYANVSGGATAGDSVVVVEFWKPLL